ncbi:MAG: ribosome small subunit-dependent GTPase A [Selenomonadaceae bacterium]|nr:ribosome small subunit-dependent GTPase A [Selenomonadaceae bacterium]
MIGRVIKFYNSFFFVDLDGEIVPCKLRGLMKRDKRSGSAIYPGDFVEVTKLNDGTGRIERVYQRKNLLMRPSVANVDQVILTFAAAEPNLNPLLLNRFIALAEWSEVEKIFICINKIDLINEVEKFLSEYESLYKIIRVSALNNDHVDNLKNLLTDKVTVLTGPSGVGKSSILNAIDPNFNLQVGKISDKIKRGKHTTRISELIPFADGFLVDTPGFSAVDLAEIGINDQNLSQCFKEFADFAGECKFNCCTHTHEPNCAVKSAVDDKKILRERYESYLSMINEINERKKSKYG